jgi:transcriptional regulator with XRE-family HTH domain
MEPGQIDLDQLAHYARWKMREKGYSLRKAADAAGVGVATLSRILNNGSKQTQPDVTTLTKIITWIGVPFEKVVKIGAKEDRKQKKQRSTLEQIEVHLRADKDLSATAAEAIANMVRVAYKQFAKKSL